MGFYSFYNTQFLIYLDKRLLLNNNGYFYHNAIFHYIQLNKGVYCYYYKHQSQILIYN
jgi:hypothetical protein